MFTSPCSVPYSFRIIIWSALLTGSTRSVCSTPVRSAMPVQCSSGSTRSEGSSSSRSSAGLIRTSSILSLILASRITRWSRTVLCALLREGSRERDRDGAAGVLDSMRVIFSIKVDESNSTLPKPTPRTPSPTEATPLSESFSMDPPPDAPSLERRDLMSASNSLFRDLMNDSNWRVSASCRLSSSFSSFSCCLELDSLACTWGFPLRAFDILRSLPI
mmetsp:Transcript_15834/g.35628  ORF Transcript_15834/g.35628 Transcript_15834/m.35628 type:complete len:218 (+) Transcript_15834:179-832(+)